MTLKNFPYDMSITVIVLMAATAAMLISHPSGYVVTMLTLVGIYAIALKGLDFVTGYTGELSVGHAALFGIGAYTAGWISLHWGVNFFLAVPANNGSRNFIANGITENSGMAGTLAHGYFYPFYDVFFCSSIV